MGSRQVTKRGYLLEVGYRDHRYGSNPLLHFSPITEDDEAFSVFDYSFDPYFLVRLTDAGSYNHVKRAIKGKAKEGGVKLKSVSKGTLKLRGEPCSIAAVKVTFTKEVPQLRKLVEGIRGVQEVHEADVRYNKRYVIDKDLDPCEPYEVTYKEYTGDESYKNDELISMERIGESSSEDGDGNTDDDEVPGFMTPEDPLDRVLAFDIEEAEAEGFPTPEEHPITMISFSMGDDDWVIDTKEQTEAEMLREFVTVIRERDPCILTTYNGDDFDFPYIVKRAKTVGVNLDISRDGSEPYVKETDYNTDVSIAGRVNVDLYKLIKRDYDQITKKVGKLEINADQKLETVAKYMGVQDEERPSLDKQQMNQAWRDNPDLLREYAKADTRDTLGVHQETVPTMVALSKIVRLPLQQTATDDKGYIVENFFMWLAKRKHEIMPNRDYREEGFGGGHVLEPERGLHEDVYYVDASSMYPNIMRYKNIGPDTLVRNPEEHEGRTEKTPYVGHHFDQETDSFIQDAIDMMFELKDEIGQLLDEAEGNRESVLANRYIACKQVYNGFYGYLGWRRARWKSYEAAESVTAWGRYYLQKAADMTDGFPLVPVIGDTDGLGVKRTDANFDINDYVEHLNQELPLTFEIDDHFELLLAIVKKRYCYLKKDGTIKVKGLEVRRGDWPPVAQAAQAETIETLMVQRSLETATEVGKEYVRRVRDGEVATEELVTTENIRKDITEYKSHQKPAKAAARAMAALDNVEYKADDAVDYLMCNADTVWGTTTIPKPLRSEDDPDEDPWDREDPIVEIATVEDPWSKKTERTVTVEHYKYDDDLYVDEEYYLDSAVVPCVMRILEPLGVTEDVIRGRPQQQTLSEVMG